MKKLLVFLFAMGSILAHAQNNARLMDTIPAPNTYVYATKLCFKYDSSCSCNENFEKMDLDFYVEMNERAYLKADSIIIFNETKGGIIPIYKGLLKSNPQGIAYVEDLKSRKLAKTTQYVNYSKSSLVRLEFATTVDQMVAKSLGDSYRIFLRKKSGGHKTAAYQFKLK